jgi:cysteine desulfuration protein SufE
MGKSLPAMPEVYKTEEHLIKGCQSRVWLHAGSEEGRLHLYADSDAIIVKGIAGMLVRVYDQSTPEEILNADTGFMDVIGLQQHLSPTRANGLASMVKQIKLYALALQMNRAEP